MIAESWAGKNFENLSFCANIRQICSKNQCWFSKRKSWSNSHQNYPNLYSRNTAAKQRAFFLPNKKKTAWVLPVVTSTIWKSSTEEVGRYLVWKPHKKYSKAKLVNFANEVALFYSFPYKVEDKISRLWRFNHACLFLFCRCWYSLGKQTWS